jgi:hypothetical protein
MNAANAKLPNYRVSDHARVCQRIAASPMSFEWSGSAGSDRYRVALLAMLPGVADVVQEIGLVLAEDEAPPSIIIDSRDPRRWFVEAETTLPKSKAIGRLVTALMQRAVADPDAYFGVK